MEAAAYLRPPTANRALQLLEELRLKYPEHVVTYADPSSLNLLSFAYAGSATATLDMGTESGVSDEMRAWTQPPGREKRGCLAEARGFAKYKYRWGQEDFIFYRVVVGYSNTQASWNRVILDPGLKKELKSVSSRFFNSKDVYADLGVPWKRGLIFYGPAGNGKTISIEALMHTLADHKDSIPTLYVKTAPATGHIRYVFALARIMSPCLLILEDIDTIITSQTRSYFFSEVDEL
ncbi:uncharacterized protein RAG0_14619 [Rhynchosporium agropyri]|uniref:ATPase AAA-type core domain-containing protein n=1 Tax=Rhynchosporium agropyri TaxID=914238 RepID=A0A1E1LJM0_9HELO|nr:uncharacterized protein RAG0_14619 [Rhynchosporium agropyri]